MENELRFELKNGTLNDLMYHLTQRELTTEELKLILINVVERLQRQL